MGRLRGITLTHTDNYFVISSETRETRVLPRRSSASFSSSVVGKTTLVVEFLSSVVTNVRPAGL
jgi:hypothetical protein